MKTLISFVLFALLLTGGYGQENDTTVATQTEVTTEITTPVQTSPTETTTVADTTQNTDTTTIVASTTSAPTTVSPSPTTPPKTSTLPVPTTSATSPAATSPEPVSSTVAPKPPIPVPELGSWNVTDGNITCIRADLKIRFMIPAEGREDYIALSPNATSEGSCNSTNGTQELRLSYNTDYVLTLVFEKNDKSAFLKNLTLVYNLPGDSGTVYNDSGLFNVQIGNSYLCSSTENVPLGNASMEIFHIHLQSYGTVENGDFGTAEECEADNKVDDIVPIAVGCALLALVVIVLIAYFVGRRRSRQKGYQSV